MSFNPNPPAVNPLPWIVWVLALPLIAMEVVLTIGETGLVSAMGNTWRIDAMQNFAFFPQFAQVAWQRGALVPYEPWRMVSYVLVHGSMTNTIFAVVILLAIGKMVGEVFRWWGVLAVWFAASVLGGLAYVALPQAQYPLLGAFPAVYGLIGAFTYLLWMRLAGSGTSQYRAFTLIGMLMGIQLLFGLLFGGGLQWVAELVGFIAGFLMSFVVSPGGIGRLRARLRQR